MATSTPTEPRRARNEPKRVKLTEERIRALALPGPRALYVYDTQAPHLALRVSSRGTKTYVVIKKINGQPKRITLGRFPALRLEDARKAAAEIAAEIACGRDPVATRKAAKARRETLQEVWAEYLPLAKARLRSIDQQQRLWTRYVAPALGKMPVKDLTRATVQRVIDNVGSATPVQANRVIALLSVLLGYGIRTERVINNVAKGVTRFPETARSRVLRSEELPPLLAAIEGEPQPWSDLFQMLFYTGARRKAVASMRWADIDVTQALWTIPARASKNKSSVAVPLPKEALTLLEKRWAIRAGEPWVFPSPVGVGHVVGLGKAWGRVVRRAGIRELRIHDVRRTVGTAMARSGVTSHVIARGLGHRNVRSAEPYIQLVGEDARQALGAAVTALTSSAKKVNLTSRRSPSRRPRRFEAAPHCRPEAPQCASSADRCCRWRTDGRGKLCRGRHLLEEHEPRQALRRSSGDTCSEPPRALGSTRAPCGRLASAE